MKKDQTDDFYVKIPYVEKQISRILFGTAFGPFMMGQEQNELLDAMLDAGITAFDTARNYMGAEISLGKWIHERKNRDKIVLLSKCGHPSVFGKKRINEKDMRKDLERSLRHLQTDFIDIYLLHRDDPDVPAGDVVEIFNAMHREGKIGAFGASNWRHERIDEANAYAEAHHLIPLTVSSPNFGLAEQVQDPWGGGCVTISGKDEAEARSWYEWTQMPMIAYSSLGRGLFSGRLKSDDLTGIDSVMDSAAQKGYCSEDNFERLRRCERLAAKKQVTVAQVALSWIFRQRINAFAVVSTSSVERMKQNIDAYDLDLTSAECRYLNLEVDTI